MKQIKNYLFLLLALSAMTIKSQSITKETPYIEVTGTAEIEVVPDEIFISFPIIEKFVTAGNSSQEKITIEKQEEKLKKELQNLGVDLNNFRPAPVRKGLPAADIPGRKYVLKVSTPSISEKVFAQLEKLEIRGGYILNQRYSKMEEIKKETRIQAMKSAKEKAAYLLAAIGEQTGKAILVQEKEYNGEQHTTGTAGSAFMPTPAALPGAMGSTEIKNIKVESEVIVRFEIK